ncbi:hypothetical protein BD626DRAFT_235609 [Schizophyllum amplum]|uniref:Uncharacterized protein n=1 Tax=Schizophyllum amplum TaxID=97359 RepID=A0A550CJ33_9AGAR|nr:hypothetical protein BD626DRAFT_235609 [Auriculariopsis ampla]
MPAYRRMKRQDISVSGLSDEGVTLADTSAAATVTNIAFDTGTDSAADYTGPVPGLVGTSSVVVTDAAKATSDASPTSSSSTPSSSAESSSNTSTNDVSLGTVIGACVGAFIGAAVIVLFGVWLYHRSTPRKRARARSMSALSNVRGDRARSQSGNEFWNKLGHGRDRESVGSDQWASQETKQVDGGITRMENLFKKSPSIRTAYTHTTEKSSSDDHPLPSSFAAYHPNLARELAGAGTDEYEVPKPFLHRIDTAPAFSWHESTTASFASLKSSNAEGRMSPYSVAIPTPPAQASPMHRWESAEVVNYEPGMDANPFFPSTSEEPSTPSDSRRSIGNPFFNAHQEGTYRRRSSSNLTPKKDKGKARAVPSIVEHQTAEIVQDPFEDADPFSDPVAPRASAMTTMTATTTHNSMSSTNDRALQSLIAVLEHPPAGSLPPHRHESYMTTSSAYSDASDVMGTPPVTPSNDPNNFAR